MSNEERNDEMVDESSDVEEQEEEYSYSDEPRKPGGSSAGIWVIIILVIAALIGVAWYQWSQKQLRDQEEAEMRRQEIRENQLRAVSADFPEAQAALESGDIDAMVEKLKQMDEKLQIIAASANSAGDTADAERINKMRGPVQQAIKAVQPIYDQIKAKREELKALEQELADTAAASFEGVRAQFGQDGTDAGDEAEPAEEPGMTDEEPAAAEEAPADEEPAADEEAAAEDEAAPEEPADPAEDAEVEPAA